MAVLILLKQKMQTTQGPAHKMWLHSPTMVRNFWSPILWNFLGLPYIRLIISEMVMAHRGYISC